MTWKFDVALESGERFIARFYPPGREWVLDFEPDLLKRSAALGLVVPQVVADARSGPSSPVPYLLYRRIEGSTLADCWSLMDAAARRRAAQELSAALERLHAVAIDGWGELVTAWRARETSWGGYVRRALDEGLAAGRALPDLSPGLLETIGFIRDRLHALTPPERSGLVWADLSPDNVVTDRDGGFVGLLDFDNCLAGELCAHLGYCSAAHLGSGFYEALRDAWRQRPTEEEDARIELYSVVRAMVIAKFACRGPLPTGLPRDPIEQLLPGLRPAADSLQARLEHRN